LTNFDLKKLSSGESGYDKNDPHKNHYYSASYAGPNSCKFTVVTAPAIGDPLPQKELKLGATVFGSDSISQILGEKPNYLNFTGYLPHRVLFFTGFCKSKDFSVEEGKKIVRSLRKIQ